MEKDSPKKKSKKGHPLPNDFEQNKTALRCPLCGCADIGSLRVSRTYTRDPNDDGWGFARDETYLCTCGSCGCDNIRLIIGPRNLEDGSTKTLHIGYEYGGVPII